MGVGGSKCFRGKKEREREREREGVGNLNLGMQIFSNHQCTFVPSPVVVVVSLSWRNNNE